MKTLEKKEETIKTCEEVLQKEIDPKYANMKKDLKNYKKYKDVEVRYNIINGKLEFLKRKQGQEGLVRIQKQIKILEREINIIKKQIKDNNKKINELVLDIQKAEKLIKKEKLEELIQCEKLKKEEIVRKQKDIDELSHEIEILQKEIDQRNQVSNDINKERSGQKTRRNILMKKLENGNQELSRLKIYLEELKLQCSGNKGDKNFFTVKLKQLQTEI